MNLFTLLHRAAGVHGSRPAVREGELPVRDYAGLCRASAAIGSALRDRLGLDPGDRVGLVMRNCIEYVEILFACWYAGLAAVPVNARLHPRELRYILGHSGARACFVSADLEAAVASCLAGGEPGFELISTASRDYRSLAEGVPGRAMAEVGDDDLAWLFYTSGTTGRPKGAMLSHRNLRAMTMSYFCDVDTIAASECIVHAAPMSHGSGLYILPHVAAAAAHVVPESGGFDTGEVIGLVGRLNGVTMFLAPTMVRRLIDDPGCANLACDRLKTIVYGGGPMYLADLDRAHERLGYRFVQIYGQGESPMTITALSKAHHGDRGHPRHRRRLASVGVAQTAVEVRVVDDGGRPLPVEENGEVVVRGGPVMRGYWQAPEATAETLRGGWLHTGDLGRLDTDGFLTLTDRARDLIISGGSNIYPREVEEVLLLHDAVAETAVVGRADREWGETVVAFIVPRPGESPTADALSRHCLEHMARFKRPREYRIVDALPKNPYGKVLKTQLRGMLAGAMADRPGSQRPEDGNQGDRDSDD